jgi:hypothetical protein
MWNTTMGATAAEYAFNERGWKHAYVVTDQFIAYTKSLSKYFVAQFKAIGGTILGEDQYTQGDQDFSTQRLFILIQHHSLQKGEQTIHTFNTELTNLQLQVSGLLEVPVSVYRSTS